MRENMMDNLIFCVNCEKVTTTAFAQWPEYAFGPDGKPTEIQRDDLNDFTKCHKGHSLDNLVVLSGPLSERPFSEPVKVEYFEVAAARTGKHFVLRRSRERIDKAMCYELLNGSLRRWIAKVEIEADSIRRQLMSERPGLSKDRIDSFVRLAENIIADQQYWLDDEDHVLIDRPMEVRHSMDDISKAYLKRNARSIFQGDDRAFIMNFIEQQKDAAEGGVLAAKLKLGFKFIPAVQKPTMSERYA